MYLSTGNALLAKIVQENRLQIFLTLRREHFSGHECEVYDFISQYYGQYGKLPSIELVSRKTSLPALTEDDAFTYYYDEYKNRVLYNKLASLIPELNNKVNNREIDEAISQVREFIDETEDVKKDGQRDLYQLSDLGDIVIDHISEARHKEGIVGVPSGWRSLDKVMGGFQKGELYILVAMKKTGKSQCLMLLADHAYSMGYIPLWVSMEMKMLQLSRRHYAKRINVGLDYIKSGMVSTFTEERIRQEQENMRGKQPFYYVQGQFKKNVEEINSLVNGLKPDILYIDGGYLVKLMRSQYKSKWEYMGELVERIKNITDMNDIPTVVTFQYNREAKKSKKRDIDHLQLSDALGQIASLVIGIDEEDPNKKDEIVLEDTRHIEILAGREGERCSFNINWDFTTMDFSERED